MFLAASLSRSKRSTAESLDRLKGTFGRCGLSFWFIRGALCELGMKLLSKSKSKSSSGYGCLDLYLGTEGDKPVGAAYRA